MNEISKIVSKHYKISLYRRPHISYTVDNCCGLVMSLMFCSSLYINIVTKCDVKIVYANLHHKYYIHNHIYLISENIEFYDLNIFTPNKYDNCLLHNHFPSFCFSIFFLLFLCGKLLLKKSF